MRLPKFGYQVFGAGQPEPAAEGYDLELDIYDVIARSDPFFGGGVSAAYVLNVLRSSQAKSVLVRIDSPGGDVTEGFAIYNHLMEHPGKVTTRVDGLAGSMASIVLLAGEDREMAFGGTVMIHNPFAVAEGEANELRGIADMLDRHRQEMLAIYSKRTGLSVARIAKMVDETSWLGCDEALDKGFVTRVTGRPVRMAAAALPSDIAKAPPKIRALLAEQARETLAAIAAADKGNEPGSRAAMTEEEMNAAVAKAVADAQAAVEAVAKKDGEMATLKAAVEAKDKEIGELKAALEKATKGEFPPKDDEEARVASAVVAAAKELTGVTDVAKLEGALFALADAPRAPAEDRGTLVAKLIAEGKLMPSRKAWALSCPRISLDTYLEATGGQKILAIGKEHQADEAEARRRAEVDIGTLALTKDELVIARTMGITPEKMLEQKKLQIQGRAS